jgi:hypothetical protein
MIDMDRLAESHYSRIDPEFDDSELEESPAFDDEEWTQIVEDAWQVTQAINIALNYADASGDKVMFKQISILSKRFTNMKGDMQL